MTKKKIYKRVGHCDPKKCGAFCCRVGPLIQLYNIIPPKTQDSFFKKFGWMSQKLGKNTFYHSNQACRYLVNLRCTLGNKRPEHPCKDFPESKDLEWYRLAKKNGCTYRFVEVKPKTSKKPVDMYK